MEKQPKGKHLIPTEKPFFQVKIVVANGQGLQNELLYLYSYNSYHHIKKQQQNLDCLH